MPNESPDNPTFDQVWEGLSQSQKQYVLARKEHTNKADAAQSIGLKPNTVYQWPEKVELAVDLLLDEAAANARSMIEQAVAKAAMTKIEGLDSGDQWVRQTAAKEILDRVLGKAVERKQVEDTTEDQVSFELPENGRENDDN